MDKEIIKKIVKDELECYLKEKENLKRNDIKTLLRNYTKYKNEISKVEQEIIDVQNGKPLEPLNFELNTPIQSTKIYKSEFDKRQDRIEYLNLKLRNLKYLVSKIENALSIISTSEYYDIIRLKYFENKKMEEILEILFISQSTYSRQHIKLINEIKSILFL